MTLLKGQAEASWQTPMPVEDIKTSTVGTSTTETITWFYENNGAWASATGQAAGTLVTAKTDYSNILNSMNTAVGAYNDTSLTVGAATRIDSLVKIPDDVFSRILFMSPADQKATISEYLTTNGHYAIDHRRGQIWAKHKATVADDTVTYDYLTGSPSPAGSALIGNVGHGKTIKTVTGTVSADTDIVAAVTGKRIKVIAVALYTTSTNANTITLKSNNSTAIWTVPLRAITGTISGANLAVPAPSFLCATVAGEKLTLDVSAAESVTYNVTYFDDDAA